MFKFASTKGSPLRRSGMLLVLAIAGVLLLEGHQAKRSISVTPATRRDYNASMLGQSLTADSLTWQPGNNSDTLAEGKHEIRITGYWKEVRASLGLSPLPDAVVVPSDLGIGNQAVKASFEEERHLRRVGRLNPALRRRRLVFVSDPRSTLTHVQDQTMKAENAGRGPFVDAERTRSYKFPDSSDGVYSESDLDKSPYAFPALFLATNAPAAPRTPVGALAASFRAIAARELKARRRGAHLRHANRML